ncbi:hypothetical protein J2X97_003653 [Epilithonimonas hungarica]|uniref:hypothetical protein n=1 Tax=Epilithonimonas hungarica TaxID=454006 RepID=UPI00277D311A|nr:hypothetical protein [Epilithonimonas hungarica]MDP9957979.1 hypothetical protein [Epilithonimonas hungarica]
MKKINLIFFLFISVFALAQNENIDSLTIKMCSNFKQTIHLNDSVRIKILNEEFIIPYLDKFSEKDREKNIDNLYFRFQKNCQNFREYLYRVDPPKSDNWLSLEKRPQVKVTDKEISQLKKLENLYYFEYAGEKTIVKTNSKYWIETFADGTNSKLYFNWISHNKFELEFIESNNVGRKNFSKKGDKYIYEVVSKEKDYFWILVTIPGQAEILIFKLFFK